MANYHYDEAGNMAAYFVITFLAFVLVPLTVSLKPGSSKSQSGPWNNSTEDPLCRKTTHGWLSMPALY
jgi:preprotein translocase subunit Sec63